MLEMTSEARTIDGRWLRNQLLALLTLAASTCVVFGPLCIHPTDILVGVQRGGRNDLTAAFLANRDFSSRTGWLSPGTAAWNPYSMFGRPWLGNPQAALHYPINWLAFLLRSPSSLGWLMVAHHLWAGLGLYALCRFYRLSACPSLLGGIVFLAAPYLLAQTGEGHVNQIFLVAWIPWAWLAFEQWRRQATPSVPLLIGILALTIFCGHAQEAFYLILILTGLVGIDALQAAWKRDLRRCGVLAGRWLVVIIALAGLTAVEIAPNWIYAKQSIRAAGISVREASQYSMGWENFWQLIQPMWHGGPDDYTGPGVFYWETLCYFGVLPLGLAIFGVLAGIRRAPVRQMSGVLLGTLLFSLGATTPIYTLLHGFVPGVAMFRVPSRALFFASFALAVLAAIGLERFLAIAVRRSRNETCSKHGKIALQRCVMAVGIGLACTAELSCFSHKTLSTIPATSIREQNSLAEFLTQNADDHRVVVSQNLLSDREAWQRGIQKVQGYEPVPLQAYALAMQAALPSADVMPQAMGFQPIDAATYDQKIVGAMGVRFVVQNGETPLPNEGTWRIVSTGEMPEEFTLRGHRAETLTYQVLENRQALPRAFVVGNARALAAGQDPSKQLRQIDQQAEVLLEEDTLPDGQRSPFRLAQITEYTPDRVAIDVHLPHPGYLVLSDMWYPGWQATDNSQPVPILRANLAFRAVPLAAGDHHVLMRYTPILQRAASAISLVTLLSVVTAACVQLLRQWTAKDESMPPEATA